MPGLKDRGVIGGAVGGAILTAAALWFSPVKPISEDTQVFANEKMSAITGIPVDKVSEATVEQMVYMGPEQIKTHKVAVYDTVTKQIDSAIVPEATKWDLTYEINPDHHIKFPDGSPDSIVVTISYPTDSTSVIKRIAFRPSDSLLANCGGIAISNMKLEVPFFALNGVKTR